MKKHLVELFKQAEIQLEYLKNVEVQFNVPQESSHGDYSTNIAMLLTKQLKKNPREIANEIIENLSIDSKIISKIEIAGPGFINFYFEPQFVNQIIKVINERKSDFGITDKFKDQQANVEFVSANPTGPLTVGHGRNAILGDTIANLLEAVGYKVDREYYFNNAGRQMRVLGNSVAARYLELLGEQIEFSDEYYQGEYIKNIAHKIYDEYSDSYKSKIEDDLFKDTAEKEIFIEIKETLHRLEINFKQFYNEDNLYKNKDIENLLKFFREKDLSYEKDEAIWLKLSELGQDMDKVIVKSSGEPTYRLPDIAYHKTKFERGYDLIIDILGSDHNAAYPDVLAGIEALGYDKKKVKVIIYQFVTITQNKRP